MSVIKEEVQRLLQTFVDGGDLKSQQYNDNYYANIEWGNIETPSAQFHCITDSMIDINDGIMRDNAKVIVFFGKHAYFENDGEQRQVVVDEMRDVAKRFIALALNDDVFEITNNQIPIYSVFSFGDAGVTGVRVEFDCITLKGECI